MIQMALTPCRACGKKISDSEEACPHCGIKEPVKSGIEEPIKKKGGNGCLIGIFVFGLLIIIVLSVAPTSEEKRKGSHCLSIWDGRHIAFTNEVLESLVDPDSFKHDRTTVTPVSISGTHQIRMRFRARNSFGGMMISIATGTFNNLDCTHTLDFILPEFLLPEE